MKTKHNQPIKSAILILVIYLMTLDLSNCQQTNNYKKLQQPKNIPSSIEEISKQKQQQTDASRLQIQTNQQSSTLEQPSNQTQINTLLSSTTTLSQQQPTINEPNRQKYERIRKSSQYHKKFIKQLKNNFKSAQYQVVNSTYLSTQKEICIDNKPCQFLYYVIHPQSNENSKSINNVTQQLNYKQIKTILFVSGMHGNQYLGPLSLLHLINHIKVIQTRIIIFPLANPSGFDYNSRLTHPNNIDPNRDFPIEQYQKCYQASSTHIIDHIFRSFQIHLTIGLHNGQSEIGWNWGTVRQNKNSQTQQQLIYRQMGQWMQYLGGQNQKNNMNKLKIGTMNEAVYPVQGSFDDWAYAASWYHKIHPQLDQSKKNISDNKIRSSKSCQYQKYPENMTQSLVFLFQLGPFQVNQQLFGSDQGVLIDPTSKTSSNGYLSRTVRMLKQIIKVLNPRLNIKFTNNQIVARLQGCKNGMIRQFKVTDYSKKKQNIQSLNTQTKNNFGLMADSVLFDHKQKIFIDGTINQKYVSPTVFKLDKIILKQSELQEINSISKAPSNNKDHSTLNKLLKQKNIIVEYELTCDVNWKSKGNTVFGKSRVWRVWEDIQLVNYQQLINLNKVLSPYNVQQSNYFETVQKAIDSFQPKSEEDLSSIQAINQFISGNKQNIFVIGLFTVLSLVVAYGMCIIGRQIRKDLKRRKLQKIKHSLQKQALKQFQSMNQVSFQSIGSSVYKSQQHEIEKDLEEKVEIDIDKELKFKKKSNQTSNQHSSKKNSQNDTYPHLCQSDKSMHTEQMSGQIVQLQQFVKQYSHLTAQ